jgi:hypothetical protein
MLVHPLYSIDNFEILVKEVMNLIDTVNFEKNQIICQNLKEHADDWKSGIGRIEELADQEERNYNQINSKLKGSYIEKLIVQHSAYRTRIMMMSPRQCYSVHADPSQRIHIPIVTNDQCWMIWPKFNSCNQLQTHRAYLTDTTKPHTFINGGTEDRIHIVMCV